ncbi:sugar-binding transcriptional regulator [Streptomyces heilongjiangensis]|uniref:Sugar-binding transcriptional regulator n=1 Tax=Streptomyces heilongjiangensis TaxID=945052 RepID=A0ABW1BJ56_9ACTN|nr:sugar-binding domain-containing protein [Streptomyces heilongjiangensis]MDC2952432.1 sugar-binding domain-containing protein [Streptomyces heilongjiangensis]
MSRVRGVTGHEQVDRVRLIVRVARMYHERGLRQNTIAQQLNLSQAGVSRLLRAAGDLGVVRTVVVPPSGIHSELEDAVAARYRLTDVVITDRGEAAGHPRAVTRALGSAAGSHLETAFRTGDRIGVSAWSRTLPTAVNSVPHRKHPLGGTVVQLTGGPGDPRSQARATRVTSRLADRVGAVPLFAYSPCLADSAEARDAVLRDPVMREVTRAWQHLDVVLVGISAVGPWAAPGASGNAVPEEDLTALRRAGAVGSICRRFFDDDGAHLDTAPGERVVGITAEQLRSVPRRIAVAGGARKYAAIRGAALGGWITALITDLGTGRRLADEP